MLDPRFNPFLKLAPSAPIHEDRPCHRCGYNVRGLMTGGRCPECGTPIRAGSVRFESSMASAPQTYLRALAQAAWVQAIGLLTAVALFAALVPAVVWPGAHTVLLALVLAAGAGAWVWGVWQTCGPRQTGQPGVDPHTEWRALRAWSRFTQIGWGLGAILILLGVGIAVGALAGQGGRVPGSPPPTPPPAAMAFYALGLLSMGVGMIGLIAVAVQLSLMADWAQDFGLGMRLRISPFMLAISLPLAVLSLWLGTYMRFTWVPVFVLPVLGVLVVAFLVCFGFFVVPVVQFASLCSWAVANSTSAMDRDRRSGERIARRVKDAQAKDQPLPGAVPRARAIVKPQGNYVAPTGDGQTYELSPVDPPRKPGPDAPTK
jgi:hypothetical protein